MERKEGRCFRETGKVCWGAAVLDTCNGTGSTGASSHCAGTLRAQALWVLHAAPAAGKRKGTAGSTCCWVWAPVNKARILLQKPAGVQLLAGAGAQPCPDPSTAADELTPGSVTAQWPWQGRELSPAPTCASCAPPVRHIVRLYSMLLLAEMPDQGRRLQRRLWACLYILWGMEHGLRLASVEPMCCR